MSDRNDLTLGSKSDEGGDSSIRSERGMVGLEECAVVLLAEVCEFTASKRRPGRKSKMSILRQEEKSGNRCVPLGKVVPQGRARTGCDSY